MTMAAWFNSQTFLTSDHDTRAFMLAEFAKRVMGHKDLRNIHHDREDMESLILVALLKDVAAWGATKSTPTNVFSYLTTIAVRTGQTHYAKSNNYRSKVHLGLAENHRGQYTSRSAD